MNEGFVNMGVMLLQSLVGAMRTRSAATAYRAGDQLQSLVGAMRTWWGRIVGHGEVLCCNPS